MHVGYIRVSTADQNPDRQHEALAAAGVRKIFEDHASGKSTERPAFQEMMTFLREGDRLTVLSLDRLARNLSDLIKIVEDLGSRGVTIDFISENLHFSGGEAADPVAKLMLQLVGAFAEFERTMIKTRQREGIELAKVRGVYHGKRQIVTQEQLVLAEKQIAAGVPVSVVARSLGLSRSTLYRYNIRKTKRPEK